MNIYKATLFGVILSIAAIVMVSVSIAGYRFGWWRHIQAFSIFGWATYTAVIALMLSFYSLYKTQLKYKSAELFIVMITIILSLPIISATTMFEYNAKAYPRINDISTDTVDPPSFWDVAEPMQYPGGSSAKLQHAAYPEIKSLKSSITAEQTFKHTLEIIQNNGWNIVAQLPNEGRIEAVISSALFGFKDEVVVRVIPLNDGSIVDIRSRSRIGYMDRGTNAKRIRQYLKELKESIAKI